MAMSEGDGMRCYFRLICAAGLVASLAYAARQPGQPLKPGFNLFSKQQDIELGRMPTYA